MGLRKIIELENAAGVTRATAIKWVRNGVVPGRQIGGLWFVDGDAVQEILGSPSGTPSV